jgi:hypothetical protein
MAGGLVSIFLLFSEDMSLKETLITVLKGNGYNLWILYILQSAAKVKD